jgi:hypothetical protein
MGTTDSYEGTIGCVTKDPGSKTIDTKLAQIALKPAPDEVFVSNSTNVFHDLRIFE